MNKIFNLDNNENINLNINKIFDFLVDFNINKHKLVISSIKYLKFNINLLML